MAEVQCTLFEDVKQVKCSDKKNGKDVKTKICSMCKKELPATNEFFHKDKSKKNSLRSRCKICCGYSNYGNRLSIESFYDQTTKQIIKICTKCKCEFPATTIFFNRSKGLKYNLQPQCNKCRKIYRDQNKDRILAHLKEYNKANKEKIRIRSKKHREANKEKILERERIYRQNNKEKVNNRAKKYHEKNREKIKIKAKIYREKNKDKIKKYIESHKEIAKARAKKHYEDNKEKRKIQKKLYLLRGSLYKTYKNNELLILIEKIRCDYSSGLLQVKCAYCGKWINPTNAQVQNRIRGINRINVGEYRFYCNDNDNACRKSCPIYKQVKYPKGFRKGTSREVAPELRQMCFERDSWECQKCGVSIQEATLHCHHIKGYTQNKILANDIDNVITLCKSCHKEVHSQEGCKYHELQCHNE